MKDACRPGGQLRKHDKGDNQFIKSKITPLFMSIATLINKFISNLPKILLKEIKDMKTDRQKKKRNKRTMMVLYRSPEYQVVKV